MLISHGVQDEVFVINEYEYYYDISSIIKDLNENKIEFKVMELNVNDLLSFIRTNMLNKETISNMSETRRDEPLIITILDGSRIIDGNHRLAKRHEDGCDTCKAVYIWAGLLESYLLDI